MFLEKRPTCGRYINVIKDMCGAITRAIIIRGEPKVFLSLLKNGWTHLAYSG